MVKDSPAYLVQDLSSEHFLVGSPCRDRIKTGHARSQTHCHLADRRGDGDTRVEGVENAHSRQGGGLISGTWRLLKRPKKNRGKKITTTV